ncbi:23S rRNA pseudouridine2605 synthase [Puniceicoccus vermicola]|uniref:pseudouridine synthase n=1 Tax=Puniceicoccus vermicola TaxID=388746 RepID=UPI0031B60C97
MKSEIRLQKFLSQSGVCSRRKAEELIREGRVEVDDRIALIGESIVAGSAVVRVDGKRIIARQQDHLTLVLNKPRHYVCTNADPHQDQTVFDLLPKIWQDPRMICAGRLDKDTEGLLILTTDGDLAQRLTHPSKRVIKRYQVRVQRDLQGDDIPKLLRGRTLEGQWLQFDKIIPPKHKGSEFEVHLDHGKKREIRRLLESFGYLVKKLKRTQIGAYKMRGLARGQARPLKSSEIKALLAPARENER